MGPIVVVLLLALALAAVVIVYAAYPYRGAETPVSPLVGRALRGGVRRLPTIDTRDADEPASREDLVDLRA